MSFQTDGQNLAGKEAVNFGVGVLDAAQSKHTAEPEEGTRGGAEISPATEAKVPDESKHSDPIIEHITSHFDLVHSPEKRTFAINKASKEILLLASQAFRNLLKKVIYELTGKVSSGSRDKDIIALLEALAAEGREVDVHIRVANVGDKVFLDIGDQERHQVIIATEGSTVIPSSSSSVHFIRPAKMQPLPIPAIPGDITPLFRFINTSWDHMILIVSWLVMALLGIVPCPALCIEGEQGSGKSTLCRMLRWLIDPSLPAISSMPGTEKNLLISALNSHICVWDNISKISNKMSDVLCRLITGAGFNTRTLFTTIDETTFDLQKPVILNGIAAIINKSDLASRALFVRTTRISPTNRLTETELWEAFTMEAPIILGGLCSAISSALKNIHNIQSGSLPRMADFAKWILAAESALPFQQGEFLTAHENNRLEVVDAAIEADVIASAVVALMSQYPHWIGPPNQLLSVLANYTTDDIRRLREWPKKPNSLSVKLKRCLPSLRERNIEISFGHSGSRSIELYTTVPSQQPTPSVPVIPVQPSPSVLPATARPTYQE